MPPGENGTADLVKKILSRKDKAKDVKEREDSPASNSQDETPEIVPPKQPRFVVNQPSSEERMEQAEDMGNMTAADLRKSSIGEFR